MQQKIILKAFIADGVKVQCSVKFIKAEMRGQDKVIHCDINGKPSEFVADEVLVSTGRVPNVEGLNLESAGVKYDKEGVHVNDHLQTTNSNVFAVGDICTAYKFTHMSDSMARIVIRNALFFGNAKFGALTIPWATYTDPEVGHVGLYEQDLKEKGIKYVTYKKCFKNNDRAILDGDEDGYVKIHVKHGSDIILGATIVAKHAGDMISEITTAMHGSLGLGKMAAIIHPYPTQAEAIRQLGDEFNRTRLTPTVKILFRKLMQAKR